MAHIEIIIKKLDLILVKIELIMVENLEFRKYLIAICLIVAKYFLLKTKIFLIEHIGLLAE